MSISTLSPSSAAIGSSAVTLVVTGTNFASSALVYFNGSPLSTTFVNAGQLNATIPASSLTAAENAAITVISSGLTSNSLTFTVGTVATTGISISCNPTVGPSSAGSTYTTTCVATGGKAPYTWTGVSLPFGLAVTNSNTNTVSITGTIYTGAYSFTLQVADSSTTPLTATYPFIGAISGTAAATITSMSPISVPAGSGQINLVVTGSGFISGVTSVEFGNTFLATSASSPSQLTAVVPANLLASPNNIPVQLSGTASNSADFFVTTGGASGVTPASLTFTYGIGGAMPRRLQTLTVTNLGGSTGTSPRLPPAGQQMALTGWLRNSNHQHDTGKRQRQCHAGRAACRNVQRHRNSHRFQSRRMGTSVTIPVTLNVLGTPTLTPSSTNLNLTTPAGGSATQTIKVNSSDGATVFPYSHAALPPPTVEAG